jgi:hypothetical protein
MSTYTKLTKDLKFIGFVGGTSLNNWSIERYDLNESEYRLIQYKSDAVGNMSNVESIDISKEAYENLDHDVYNNLVRFQAASELFISDF